MRSITIRAGSAIATAVTSTICLHAATITTTEAFTFQTVGRRSTFSQISPLPITNDISSLTTRLYADTSDDDGDNEIERLKSMAAKLRAEAASLEAEKANQLAKAAEKAFQEFDTNKDGAISVVELKAGLERKLKMDLSESRVQDLMKAFDASGDGALQLDEFAGVDVFRNKLEALARDEKELAKQAENEAKLEQEKAALAEARVNFLNEKAPTNSDKVFAVIPYLFPLLDGLQYGRFIFNANEENPVVIGLAIFYTLYKNIPFSGFAAFFALNFLSNNPKVNRIVRFNMQQAIFVDIALFFPGLVSGLFGAILKGAGTTTPPAFAEVFSDVTFVTLLVALAYCTASTLLGAEPNKLPLISQAVSDRMPNIDMFDDEGNFVPREGREEEKKDDEEKK